MWLVTVAFRTLDLCVLVLRGSSGGNFRHKRKTNKAWPTRERFEGKDKQMGQTHPFIYAVIDPFYQILTVAFTSYALNYVHKH